MIMTAGIKPLTEPPAWKALEGHYDEIRNLHLRKLFADDPKRGEHMTAEAAGIYLDYSKNGLPQRPSSYCSTWRRLLGEGSMTASGHDASSARASASGCLGGKKRGSCRHRDPLGSMMLWDPAPTKRHIKVVEPEAAVVPSGFIRV